MAQHDQQNNTYMFEENLLINNSTRGIIRIRRDDKLS